MLEKSFIEEMKQQLLSHKQKLQQELSGVRTHEELGSDMDSNVQEVEGDEISRDISIRIKSDLEKIEKALSKIAEGNYGVDDEGEEISKARLRVIPWADRVI
jgi:RNA polymerase-binding transcription factor DksA